VNYTLVYLFTINIQLNSNPLFTQLCSMNHISLSMRFFLQFFHRGIILVNFSRLYKRVIASQVVINFSIWGKDSTRSDPVNLFCLYPKASQLEITVSLEYKKKRGLSKRRCQEYKGTTLFSKRIILLCQHYRRSLVKISVEE